MVFTRVLEQLTVGDPIRASVEVYVLSEFITTLMHIHNYSMLIYMTFRIYTLM